MPRPAAADRGAAAARRPAGDAAGAAGLPGAGRRRRGMSCGLWLGPDFAAGGGRVLHILGLGIFFSCVAFAPARCSTRSAGRMSTARFALLQAVVFLPLAALLMLWSGSRARPSPGPSAAPTDCPASCCSRCDSIPPAREAARRLALPLLAGGSGWRCCCRMHGLPTPGGGRAAGADGLHRSPPSARSIRPSVASSAAWSAASARAAAASGGAAMMPLAINGRFLTQRVTGVQRFATEITAELDALAEGFACPAPGCCGRRAAALAVPHLPASSFGRLRGQAWEQLELPLAGRAAHPGEPRQYRAAARPAGDQVVVHPRRRRLRHAGELFAPPSAPGTARCTWPLPRLGAPAAHRLGLLPRPDRAPISARPGAASA